MLISRLVPVTTSKWICKHVIGSFSLNYSSQINTEDVSDKKESKRMAEFKKKLRETTNIDDLGDQPLMPPQTIEDSLPPWPDNKNPNTGELGGPKGPEPTRFGDWERKGRVTDF